jgi:hypothetical protein
MDKSAEQIISELAQPFDYRKIHFRIGARTRDKTKGIPLAYIDARDAMERLDAVVGPANWQRRYPWSDSPRLYCEVGIRIDGEWIWKGDGAGDTDVEAEKGAFSDAFKRACVNWGIAQYLYDVPNAWVDLQNEGKKFADEANIRDRLAKWQDQYFQRKGAGNADHE